MVDASTLANRVWGDSDFRGEFRLLTEERIRDVWERSSRDDPSSGDAMPLEHAREFSNLVERKTGTQVSPPEFMSDDEFFEMFEQVQDDWPDARVLFGGAYGENGYIDTVFIPVEEVEDVQGFKEYCVVHFKHDMSYDTCGVDPYSDNRITVPAKGEPLRDVSVDSELWCVATHFGFRECPGYGECLRLWFD